MIRACLAKMPSLFVEDLMATGTGCPSITCISSPPSRTKLPSLVVAPSAAVPTTRRGALGFAMAADSLTWMRAAVLTTSSARPSAAQVSTPPRARQV